jgi:membrane-bound lytic murein transglycosylase D
MLDRNARQPHPYRHFRHRLLTLCASVLLAACAQQPIAPEDGNADQVPEATLVGVSPPVITPEIEVLERPDLWRELRRSFTLDRHIDDRRVRQELAWFRRHPNYLPNLQPRLEQYLGYIFQRVVDRDLPGEIALLPIVESALDPYAFSPGGAAGLWQFISATGRRFGLQRNWWYDGRRDPVAATEAALDFLEYLNRRFDNWPLALAGYNTGEGNVARALKRKGADASFWEIKLPRETSAYVPRLLALAEIVAHPEKYGVTLPELTPEIPFRVLATGGQLDLNVAADATQLPVATLYQWNPALNQWSTPPEGPHHLLVPKNTPAAAQASLDAIPAQNRVRWLRIKVGNGDTLSELALRYRTDVSSLRAANNLRGSSIRAGQPLLIPKSASALENPVARRTGGSSYIVRNGDSLWTISRAHNVSMNKLMRANHVGPKEVLRVGQKLTIPGKRGNNAIVRKVRYGVRRGDSLARIASKFNVSVADISNWNELDTSRYLQPGQSLTLYVDVAAGE